MNVRALADVDAPVAPAVTPAAGITPPPAPPRRYPWRLHPDILRRRGLERGRQCELSRSQRRVKRLLDLLVCAAAGPPAAVLIGLAALAIRLESPGSPLFSHARVGQHGRPFRMWKLRTMIREAPAMEGQLRHLNDLPWPDFKIRRDPRVTRVGAWLRRTSIDELPQLWNVLRGEMSIVGPRPTLFGLSDYQLWQTERLALQPGLTGLWQILERAQCDFDRRLRLDLAYVRHWRLTLDLKILAATVGAVILGRGAS